MRAIHIPSFGSPEVLTFTELPRPIPGPEELLVKVAATALNRADTLQRRGLYPPPKGASPLPGLEMTGEIVATGEKVAQWQLGDQVMALLSGGGYAEYVVIHQHMAMAIPQGFSLVEAAAIPEVFLTAYQALIRIAHLQAGEKALIHAGASGVGTAAIQLAKLQGAEVWISASASKHAACQSLGADHCIDYKTEDFEARVLADTQGQGVDVVLDFLAASYFNQNINSLSTDGRLVMLALMGGSKVSEVKLAKIIGKRLRIEGSTLRSRSLAYKIALTRAFEADALTHFASGKLKPVIDRVYPWTEVQAAHERMEANLNIGKIVLALD